MNSGQLPYYEFFAGGGMARLGLGPRWKCLFANDVCEKKARSYRANFPPGYELAVKSIYEVNSTDLPGQAFLAWASFPCQDLSLAGNQKGLKGERSSTFWPFWELMKELAEEQRPVPIIVLENVVGAITSNGGRDFSSILEALAENKYRVGAMVIDSIDFVPQSRPRLFVIAVDSGLEISAALHSRAPSPRWHSETLVRVHRLLDPRLQDVWLWWRLPSPPARKTKISDLIEDDPNGVVWHSPEQTKRLISQMSETNLRKLHQAQHLNRRVIGTIYKRTRKDENGGKAQRAEVRFDEISGCLRTPAGGSSRQIVLEVNREKVRSRLLSPREAARLMGAPESYRLPANYNEAYHLMGDALVAPVVSWLEKHLLTPLALGSSTDKENLANGQTYNSMQHIA